MPVIVTNNAVSRLASSLTIGATALSVNAGDGAKFPSPSAGSWFPVTVVKASGALEIVRCTSRSGDVLTIARAQEGTAAQAFAAGDRVELRLTAAAFAELQTLISETLRKDDNLSSLTDKAASRNNLGLKTGAVTDKQTSSTDVTAGSLLILGGHGVGAGVTSLAAFNLNNAVVGSFSEVNGLNSEAAANNWPILSALDGAVGTDPVRYDVSTYGSTLYTIQRALFTLAAPARAKGRAYIRIRINGAWQPWGIDFVEGAYGFGRTPTLLTSSDDLNNVNIFGKFSWGAGSIPANAPKRATGAVAPPSVQAGRLEVFEVNGTSYEQVVTDLSTGEIFRRGSANGVTWNAWMGEFAIIYPGNGNPTAPTSILPNSRYVTDNPFAGNHVIIQPEIYVNSLWSDPGWEGNTGTGANAWGVRSSLAGGQIVTQTGISGVLVNSNQGGGGHDFTGSTLTSAQCRVKVWKVTGT